MPRQVSKELVNRIKNLAYTTDLKHEEIAKIVGMSRSSVTRLINPYRAKESKPRIGKFERQGSLEELMQAPGKMAAIKQYLNDFKIGETIEVKLKVQIEHKKKELQVHTGTIKQKNEHCLFVVFENGRIQSISDFELLTKETRIRKVG